MGYMETDVSCFPYPNNTPSFSLLKEKIKARYRLNGKMKALKCFHQQVMFGERHLFDKVGYDYFAVSMPELEVYQDDIQKRSDDYCRRLTELGRKGLG